MIHPRIYVCYRRQARRGTDWLQASKVLEGMEDSVKMTLASVLCVLTSALAPAQTQSNPEPSTAGLVAFGILGISYVAYKMKTRR